MAAADYPLPKFHFQVEWGGSSISFAEISGLEMENELIEYREGASREFTKLKMPGLTKFSNVVMKKGVFTEDNDYFEWWKTIKMNTVERRDISVSLLNEEHEPVMTWSIKNAWPIKIVSTDLKADEVGVAIATIEVAHEGCVIEA
jgi:phage tail-like protein